MLPRFQQQLVRDGAIMEDAESVVPPADLQLVKISREKAQNRPQARKKLGRGPEAQPEEARGPEEVQKPIRRGQKGTRWD